MRVVLIRVDPLAYSFLSGIFVSVAANLFTGIYGGESLPNGHSRVLFAAALALVSGCLWMYAGYLVSGARRCQNNEVEVLGKSFAQAEAAIANDMTRLPTAVIMSTLISFSSLLVLIPLRPSGEGVASKSQAFSVIKTEPACSPTKLPGQPPLKGGLAE